MQLPDVLEVESGRAQCRDGGVSGNEMSTFARRVYDDHRGIEPMGVREFDDEVDANSIPSRFGDWERVKLTEWLTFLCLRSKTQVACLAVLPDVARHVRPPVAPRNEFEGLPASCMSPDFGVVVLFGNLASQFGHHRYVDAVAEPPKSILHCPLRTSQRLPPRSLQILHRQHHRILTLPIANSSPNLAQ